MRGFPGLSIERSLSREDIRRPREAKEEGVEGVRRDLASGVTGGRGDRRRSWPLRGRRVGLLSLTSPQLGDRSRGLNLEALATTRCLSPSLFDSVSDHGPPPPVRSSRACEAFFHVSSHECWAPPEKTCSGFDRALGVRTPAVDSLMESKKCKARGSAVGSHPDRSGESDRPGETLVPHENIRAGVARASPQP